MNIRTMLPLALAVAVAACQDSPTAPLDVRPLDSSYVGGGNRDEPAAPVNSVYAGGGNREQTDSASTNSTYLGSGTRQGEEDGEDTARNPFMGGTGG